MDVVDSDSHPFADHRLAVLARRANLELPRGVEHCAVEVRACRIAFQRDAIVDPVLWIGLAGDEPETLGRVFGQIKSEFLVGWLARPFGPIESLAVGALTDDLRIIGGAARRRWPGQRA